MKDREYYICDYCNEEYKPTRRRVQKYCSNSCRSKAYVERNLESSNNITPAKDNFKNNVLERLQKQKEQKQQIEKVSLAGVGNATLGSLAADGIKSIATPKHARPATKGDIAQLIEKLNARYLLISNLPPNQFGQYPYYDLVEGRLVYLVVQ